MAWFVRSDASKSLDSGRKTARPDSGRARTIGQLRLWRSLPVQDYPGRGAYLARLGRPVRPPTRPAPTRPPAFPPARPNSARARIPAAGSRVLLGPLHGPLGGAGFICCFQERTVPHTSARLARVAHCPKRALPRVGLRALPCPAPMVPGPSPPCLARQSAARPNLSGPACPAPPHRARPGPAPPSHPGPAAPRRPRARPRPRGRGNLVRAHCPARSRPQTSRGPRRPLRAAGMRAAPRLPCGWSLARSRVVQTSDLARAAQTAPGRRRAGRSQAAMRMVVGDGAVRAFGEAPAGCSR
jgi:hypothetical protein